MNISLLLLIMICFIGMISPGPDFILVTKNDAFISQTTGFSYCLRYCYRMSFPRYLLHFGIGVHYYSKYCSLYHDKIRRRVLFNLSWIKRLKIQAIHENKAGLFFSEKYNGLKSLY